MNEIKEICVSRIDRMGDMILSLPVIKAIKVVNPNIKITIFSSHKNSKILEGLQYIDTINVINTNRNIFYLFNKFIELRKFKFDYYINLSPTLYSYLICFFSKSNKKATLIYLSRYKKSIFSKFIIRLLAKVFCLFTCIVDRNFNLKNNIDFHLTNMINLCKINYTKKVKTEILLPRNKVSFLNKSKKLITIHLNNKWINNYFNENDFCKFIDILPKKNYQYVLTTDDSSKKKFKLIFEKFKNIENKDLFSKKIFNDDILILNKFTYQNWLQVIYSSLLCITPECGCSHIAAACKIPVIIIYDADNYPNFIQKEYHPWKSPLEKKFDHPIFSNDNKLIEKIILILKNPNKK